MYCTIQFMQEDWFFVAMLILRSTSPSAFMSEDGERSRELQVQLNEKLFYNG